jgi:hypothetical protein
MASLENYKDLKQTISKTVNTLYYNGPSDSLKLAFEPGGEIFAILQTLEAKKQRINEYQKDINSLEIINEETNKLSNQNRVELTEINALQNKLEDLSAQFAEPRGNFARQGVVDNFIKSLLENKEVQQGFFTTIFNTISRAFYRTNQTAVKEAKDNLNKFKDVLEKEPEDRYKLPNKGEIAPTKEIELSGKEKNAKNNTINDKNPIENKSLANDSLKKEIKGKFEDEIPEAPLLKEESLKSKESVQNKQQPMDLLSQIRKRGSNVKGKSGDEIPEAPLLKEESLKSKESVQNKQQPMDLLSQIRKRGGNVKGKSGDEIPEAPPLKEESLKSKESVQNKPQPMDLLSQIRERGKKNTNKVSLDQGDFKYLPIQIQTQDKIAKNNAILDAMSSLVVSDRETSQAEQLLTEKSKKEQLNVLYSAMVDNKQELVKDLLNHEVSVKTGTTVDEEGWDVDVLENKKLFSSEDLKKVQDAVTITQDRVKNGVETPNVINAAPSDKDKQNEPKAEKKEEIKVSASNEKNTLENDDKIPVAPILDESKFQNKIKNKPLAENKNLNKMAPRGNLLDAIKQGANLKKVENHDMDGFTYQVSEKKSNDNNAIKNALANKFKSEIDYGEFLDDKTEKQQLDYLYTAVINGEKEKIQGVIEYAEDNDLDFAKKENIQKLYNAAIKVSSTRSNTQKIVTEKGCQVLAKETDLKINQNKSIER